MDNATAPILNAVYQNGLGFNSEDTIDIFNKLRMLVIYPKDDHRDDCIIYYVYIFIRLYFLKYIDSLLVNKYVILS
jgi:hypothetical protein